MLVQVTACLKQAPDYIICSTLKECIPEVPAPISQARKWTRSSDEINITSDAEKRAELVGQAQELIHEESPFIYIAFTKNIIGAGSKVRGFVPTPTAMYDFRTVYFVE